MKTAPAGIAFKEGVMNKLSNNPLFSQNLILKEMKKIIITSITLATLFITNVSNAQVAIGKEDVTNQSVLLEFGSDNKGLILPSVEDAPEAVGGTFVFNTTDNSVEVWEGKNNGGAGDWTNLTQNDVPGVPHAFVNSGTDVGDGVVIGADTTDKPGVLVLESTTSTLVLPQVASPHENMPGAIAGTMVYDTDADMIAVYDGANWSYWK